jgi:hypothetical protein
MGADPQSARQKVIVRFYQQVDAGQLDQDLFTTDFQFFFPKFGIGRGAKAFLEMVLGFGGMRSQHHIEDLLFIEAGNFVAVEGTTHGADASGVEWCGGRTPGGRFSSIFEFNAAGQIARMHVYLDPDFTGANQDGFRWRRGAEQAW